MKRTIKWALLATAIALTIGPNRVNAGRPADRDSIPDPLAVLAPIHVEAAEFTVLDVVRRTLRGERNKLGAHRDMTYTAAVRATSSWPVKRMVDESVYRVYEDSTGYARSVFVASREQWYTRHGEEWIRAGDEPAGDPPGYRIREHDINSFLRLPFYLQQDDEFDFHIIDRILDGDRVVFHVAFRPKSDFSPLPRGEMFVDSKGFHVIHEIYEFNENPMPMVIRGLRRCSLQWQCLAGGEWVPKRGAAEIELRNDPFGVLPDTVSFVVTFDDFRFDVGYDARLFGAAQARAERPTPVVGADSASAGAPAILAELQREDDARYSASAQGADSEFVASSVNLLDSLGIVGLPGDAPRDGRAWGVGVSPSVAQWDYNRTEGFLFGATGRLGQVDRARAELTAFGAYATGSETFRYSVDARAPLPGSTLFSLAGWYRDRVDPFGSNRIALNGVRALFGGADEQDYLHRVGGGVKVRFEPNDDAAIEIGFDAAGMSSVATTETFSLFGNMDHTNPAIEAGNEHGMFVHARSDVMSEFGVDASFRSAGGALGGDFRYQRGELTVRAHRYVIGRHGLGVSIKAVGTGGDPPLQYLADIGGLSTVRGYDRRAHVGKRSVTIRGEYLLPYDILAHSGIPLLHVSRLQFVAWGDAGRVDEGDSRDWIGSVGTGVQRYLGSFGDAANLRFDVAFPLSGRQPDVVLYLWFTSTWQ